MTTHNHQHNPRPLHLLNSTQQVLSTQSDDAYPSQSPSYSKRSSVIIHQHSHESTTPRRQSSIFYFPPDSTETPRRGILARRNSLGTLDAEAVQSQETKESRSRKRMSLASFPATSVSIPNTPERPPLTLTEKHADLLRFIAQKESKCLELRSQLAIHETELSQLKRKWERIVNRGFDRNLHSASLSNGDTMSGISSPTVLEGIKEMSRLIVGGFSHTDSDNHSGSKTLSPSISRPNPKIRPTSLSLSIQKSHSTKESISSISTYATKSTTRFSQSSMSSFGEEPLAEIVCGSPSEKEDVQEQDGDSSDNSNVLMVRDTGATPTMSPNPAFHQQQYRHRQKDRQKHSQSQSPALSPHPGLEHTDTKESVESKLGEDEDTWTSSSNRKTTNVHRRRSRDASHLDLGSLDFSTLSPSVMLSPPALSSRSISPSGSVSDRSKSDNGSDLRNGRSSVGLNGNNTAGLPPMSSIPGFSSLAAGAVGAAPPVGLWMDSMGKKLGQLQRSSTFTKSQNRASLLFADMSQSIVSALTSPSTPSTSVSANTSVMGTPSGIKCSLVLSSSGSTASSPSTVSLLDDDDGDDTVKFNSAVMMPAQKQLEIRPVRTPAVEKASTVKAVNHMDDDDEEWNW